jgi:hypothetical protein
VRQLCISALHIREQCLQQCHSMHLHRAPLPLVSVFVRIASCHRFGIAWFGLLKPIDTGFVGLHGTYNCSQLAWSGVCVRFDQLFCSAEAQCGFFLVRLWH